MERLILEAKREVYEHEFIEYTITVGELIEFLDQYDDDCEVIISNSNGYTYGGISEHDFRKE